MKNVFSNIKSVNGRNHSNLLRLASVGLCLAIGSSLVACNGSVPSINGGTNGNGDQAGVKTVSADQPFFSSKKLDFYQTADKEDAYIVSSEFSKDKLLVMVSATTYDESYYSEIEAKMAEVKGVIEPSASSEESLAEETAAGETTAETEAEESTASSDVSDETSAIETSADETNPDGEVPEDEIYDPEYQGFTTKYILLTYSTAGELLSQVSFDSLLNYDSSIIDFKMNDDGSIKLLTRTYNPETYEPAIQESVVDSTGKVIKEPTDINLKKGFDPYTVSYDDAGNAYFMGYLEKPTIIVTDPSGKSLFEISEDNLSMNVFMIDGKVYADGYDSTNNYTYSFYEIDVANKKMSDPIDMSFMRDVGMGILTGPEGLYYQTGNGINKIDFEKKESKEIVSWNDCEFERQAYGGDQIFMLTDSSFIAITSFYDEDKMVSTTTPYLLTKEASNPNAGKKIITLGGMGLTYDETLRSNIYEFNKASTEYRIVSKDYEVDIDYSKYETEDDYMQAYADIINKMNLEIISGDGPDIIYGSYADFSLYESKGLLVDLYTKMEGDTTFKKEDILPGILQACENDGKLCKLGSAFSVVGLAGAKSVIGDRTGWTIEEFQQIADSLPEKMEMISPYSNRQSDILLNIMYSSMGTFVNSATGEVKFDTDEFRSILKLAKDYGRDDDAIDDGSYWVDEREQIRNGELALMTAYISDLYSYQDVVSAFGEPVSFVGYPSASKTGTSCYMNSMLAISSESPSIDAAWTFVKGFFTEEAQDKIADNYQIPVLRASLEKSIQEMMDPENPNNIYYSYDGQESKPITEESAAGYRALVESVTVFAIMDPTILSIVREEVAPYFNDQKTAEDVSKLIQNRVETIVKEKR